MLSKKKALSIEIVIWFFAIYCIVFGVYFWHEGNEDPIQDAFIGKDGAEMALIPAGKFLMDSRKEYSREKIKHIVYIDDFYIDKYEITNAQYKKFTDATGHSKPKNWNNPNFNKPNQPVVGVTWYDAVAYTKWAGKRLPTEAEWEKAARGGLKSAEFPWGNMPANKRSHEYANYSGIYGKDRWNFTAPVGSFTPNGYGLYDMSGNALEWCSDWYISYHYIDPSETNPKGPDSGNAKVIRSGSCLGGVYSLSNSNRQFKEPAYADNLISFRCAMDVLE